MKMPPVIPRAELQTLFKKQKENQSTKSDSILENTKIENTKNYLIYHKENGFYIEKGRYYAIEKVRGTDIKVELSNFTMKSIFHLLNGTNNTMRILFIQRGSGEKHFIEVYSNEMKPETFETILKSKRCTFYGNAYQLKKIFAQTMDDEIEAEIIHYLGWNAEFRIYVFADSVFSSDNKLLSVNQIGIIEDQKNKYYLPSCSFANINNEAYNPERLYKFLPGNTDFKTWSDLFYQAFGENAVIGILYTILSIYRDVVFSQVGFFPFLFLFGDFGTGKTSYTENLLSLFGRDTIGTPLNNATTVALSRLVSSRSNSIFYFKEYTNETDESAEDFILTAYDGAGRTTGIKSNDNKTKTFPVRSALIFDGNHLPSQKSAILSRMVLLNFQSSTFTNEQKTAYSRLKELEETGFGNVLLEILKLRPIIEAGFVIKYRDVSRKIKDSSIKLPERSINHTSLLYAIYELLEKNICFPFSTDVAKKIIINNAENLNSLLKESSAVHVFWESFSFHLKKSNITQYSENGFNNTATNSNKNVAHFRIKNEPDELKILQIKLQSYYPLYVKYCKDNSIKFLDQNSIKMILTSKSNDSFIPGQQAGRGSAYTDKKFGSCHQFRLKITDTGVEINEVELFL